MTARAAPDGTPPLRSHGDPVAVRCRRVLMVAFHYPPANTPGALRALKFTKSLGELHDAVCCIRESGPLEVRFAATVAQYAALSRGALVQPGRRFGT